MHIPAAFAQPDPRRIRAHLERYPLATVVGLLDGKLCANHLPLMCETDLATGSRLIGHVARANPVWRLGEENAPVLAIFTGAEAYVSPSYYPGKAETHRVVPTYNYASVHVAGRVAALHEPADKLRIVDRLTGRMEAGREAPWAVADAPPDYVRRMLEGIVAIAITVESVEAKWKASQNKSPQDQRGVAQGLRRDAGGAAALDAAALIEELTTQARPGEEP